jgi:hypothetical protein
MARPKKPKTPQQLKGLAIQAMLAAEGQVFFDKLKIEDPMEAKRLRAMSKFGAFVRTRAQRSMRRRKGGQSEPGKPPFAHSGELRELLFFSYEQASDTVVVGPILFGRRKNRQTVPRVHEMGGALVIDKPPDLKEFLSKLAPADRWRAYGKAKALGVPMRSYVRRFMPGGAKLEPTQAHYPKRPYMKPALDAELPKFAEQFQGRLRTN